MPFDEQQWKRLEEGIEENKASLISMDLLDHIMPVMRAEFVAYGELFDMVCQLIDTNDDREAIKAEIANVLCTPVFLRAIVATSFVRLLRETNNLCTEVAIAANTGGSLNEAIQQMLRVVQILQMINMMAQVAAKSLCEQGDCSNCPFHEAEPPTAEFNFE